jgi:hypothetical protein
MKKTLALSFLSLLAVGCVHSSDIELHNPIVTHAVEPNRIVKDHGYAENARGLPAGALADEAILTTADPAKVCFAVTLHELAPIDLQGVEASLESPKKDPIENAQLWAEPTTFQTYDGLIPEQREVGTQTVCASHNSDGTCASWTTHPVYQTFYIRGPVNVYQARGKLCFANQFVTSATEQITLALKLQRQGGVVQVGWFGAGAKKIVFRWGFLSVIGPSGPKKPD